MRVEEMRMSLMDRCKVVFILVAGVVLSSAPLLPAQTTLPALTSMGTVDDSNDVMWIIDSSAADPKDRKITVAALRTALLSAGSVDATALGTDSVSADELDAGGVEAELEAVLDLDELQGQIGDLQVADGAIDGGSGGEIADGSVTAADLGTDSVSADELNATGVEAELEAVLDLEELQGAVTDGQLPSTLTGKTFTAAVLFSGTDHAGVRLISLTTAQRDALGAPAAGDVIWNTTTAQVERYNGSAWGALAGGGSAIVLNLGDDGTDESTDLSEIATTGDTNSIFTESVADKLLIDVGRNWPAADSATQAGEALTGDSATAFFAAGELAHERGGVEADVSAFSGLLGVNAGATSEVDTEGELETHLGGLDVVTLTADDLSTANLMTILSDEGIAGTYLNGNGTWTTPAGSGDMTKAVYDSDDNTFTDSSENVVIEVNNDSGVQIDDGSVVYVSGFDIPSDLPEISLADADAAATMPAVGIVNGDIANGADGEVIISGIWEGNTSAFTVLDALYVSGTAGALTATKPTASTQLVQKVGIVARDHATTGQIVVTGAGRSNDAPNAITEPDLTDGSNYVRLSLSGDRLFHDTDSDGTKDAGEEFIDQASGGGVAADTDLAGGTSLSVNTGYFDTFAANRTFAALPTGADGDQILLVFDVTGAARDLDFHTNTANVYRTGENAVLSAALNFDVGYHKIVLEKVETGGTPRWQLTDSAVDSETANTVYAAPDGAAGKPTFRKLVPDDLATGTDGELITWDASGNPATVGAGTSGQVLTSNGAGAAPTFQAAASGGGWQDTAYAIKTDTQAAISSTSAVNVTQMSFSIGANETWFVTYCVRATVSAPSADARFAVDVPTGATVGGVIRGDNTNGDLINGDDVLSAGCIDNNNEGGIHIEVQVSNGANAGTVQLRAASSDGAQTVTIGDDMTFFRAVRAN